MKTGFGCVHSANQDEYFERTFGGNFTIARANSDSHLERARFGRCESTTDPMRSYC